MTRGDYGDISSILQAIINPLTAKLQILEDKVDKLNQDRVTRTDIEKLRTELMGSMVPRDAYEPRHLALVERQATLEGSIREEHKDRVDDIKAMRSDVEQDLHDVHERIKEQQEVQLSTKDRTWLRVSQGIGFVSIVIAILDWIFQHIKFQ